MEVTGWNLYDKPFYEHDCTKCKFLFSLSLMGKNEILKNVDVYESCEKDLPGHNPWLIRYSSEGSDYATTDLRTLMAYHTIGYFGNLR